MATIDQLKALGSIIRERRGRMSAAELGQKIGRSQSYVSALENATVAQGQSKPITPPDDVLEALATILGVSIADFHRALGRVEPEKSDRPMLIFVEQKLREGQDGEIVELSPEQAEQLVEELEEFAELRITQVQRQSQKQSGGGKQSQGQKQTDKKKEVSTPAIRPTVTGLNRTRQ